VEEIIIASDNSSQIQPLDKYLLASFEKTDLNPVQQFLGPEIAYKSSLYSVKVWNSSPKFPWQIFRIFLNLLRFIRSSNLPMWASDSTDNSATLQIIFHNNSTTHTLCWPGPLLQLRLLRCRLDW